MEVFLPTLALNHSKVRVRAKKLAKQTNGLPQLPATSLVFSLEKQPVKTE
jgi:hypothetical protein